MKRSNLVRMDNAFLPFYWLTKQLKSIAPRRNQTSDQVVILKLFGVGSITRIAHVLQNSKVEKKAVFLTLKRNKGVVDLLGLEAIYINDKNPFVLLFSAMQRVVTIWQLRKAEIVDMERSSNMAGMYSLILSIRKKHAQFKVEGENVEKKNRRIISLEKKAATSGIAEMLHAEPLVWEDAPVQSKSRKRIVVNINAGGYLPERKFPMEKWSQLIKGVAELFPEGVFYFSGLESERKGVEAFCKRIAAFLPSSRCTVLAGEQSLPSFVDFLKASDLFLTNDSGPLHLARYFGVRTVAVWGPTSSYLVGYPNSARMLNLSHELACSPCFISPKSEVAKACNGKLSCFHEMDVEKSLLKINEFVNNGNQ